MKPAVDYTSHEQSYAGPHFLGQLHMPAGLMRLLLQAAADQYTGDRCLHHRVEH